MIFYDLSDTAQSIFLTLIFFILCLGCVCTFNRFKRKRIFQGAVLMIGCIFSIVFLMLYSANMFSAIQSIKLPKIVRKFSELPIIPVFLILSGIVILEVTLAMEEFHYRNNSITYSSIKESLDHLNTGLCFFNPNGVVMLINHKMLELGFALSNRDIQNGELFWELLKSGNVSSDIQCISCDETPEYLLPDGTIWTFRKEQLEGVTQLTATDTTVLHQLLEQQRKENENLEKMCHRIQSYGRKVHQYVIAKERLETRVNLHSFLGQALLTTRHFLQYDGGDAEKILKIWKRNIDVLQLETEAQQEFDTFSELKKNAKAVGIEVTINGNIPKESRIKKILAATGVEAVINAGKHANAKNVYIDIEEINNTYVVRYTNDGAVPKNVITEGGGLNSLRARVEHMGGVMNIAHTPKFVLTIILEKEV